MSTLNPNLLPLPVLEPYLVFSFVLLLHLLDIQQE